MPLTFSCRTLAAALAFMLFYQRWTLYGREGVWGGGRKQADTWASTHLYIWWFALQRSSNNTWLMFFYSLPQDQHPVNSVVDGHKAKMLSSWLSAEAFEKFNLLSLGWKKWLTNSILMKLIFILIIGLLIDVKVLPQWCESVQPNFLLDTLHLWRKALHSVLKL